MQNYSIHFHNYTPSADDNSPIIHGTRGCPTRLLDNPILQEVVLHEALLLGKLLDSSLDDSITTILYILIGINQDIWVDTVLYMLLITVEEHV